MYDRIGPGYARTRRADPRIAAYITAAVGNARSVVNVGAGTGNYEPTDRELTIAVEPASAMIAQRPPGSPPVLRAFAESLPFRDRAFDAALAVLTMHHWRDRERGLAEMRRVADRQIVYMFETAMTDSFWLLTDYFPEILDIDSERSLPSTADLGRYLDVRAVEPVPVPADCVDGFGGCYWNRPEAYLEPDVRAGMSSFAKRDDDIETRGVARLRDDLASGAWDARHGRLRSLPEYDIGYRLVIAGGKGPDE